MIRGGTTQPTQALRAAARALAELHTSDTLTAQTPARTGADEAGKAAKRAGTIAQYVPTLAGETDRVASRLCATLSALPRDVLRPAHGSYKSSQLLFRAGSVHLVDFDQFCRADPALDVGYFLAYLRPPGLWYHRAGTRAWFARAATTFLTAYDERLAERGVDAPTREGIRRRCHVYEAALLLKIAARRPNRLHSPRPGEVQALLAEVTACLDAVDGASSVAVRAPTDRALRETRRARSRTTGPLMATEPWTTGASGNRRLARTRSMVGCWASSRPGGAKKASSTGLRWPAARRRTRPAGGPWGLRGPAMTPSSSSAGLPAILSCRWAGCPGDPSRRGPRWRSCSASVVVSDPVASVRTRTSPPRPRGGGAAAGGCRPTGWWTGRTQEERVAHRVGSGGQDRVAGCSPSRSSSGVGSACRGRCSRCWSRPGTAPPTCGTGAGRPRPRWPGRPPRPLRWPPPATAGAGAPARAPPLRT